MVGSPKTRSMLTRYCGTVVTWDKSAQVGIRPVTNTHRIVERKTEGKKGREKERQKERERKGGREGEREEGGREGRRGKCAP